MKALTIQQPYAHLIALPDGDDRAKRVENRTWESPYIGTLAIHAGRGRDYLCPDDERPGWDEEGVRVADMAFGAVVAVAELRGCVRLDARPHRMPTDCLPEWARRRWPWLACHRHVEGPVCWILAEVRAMARPVPCRGAQGLFDLPPEVEAAVREQITQGVSP